MNHHEALLNHRGEVMRHIRSTGPIESRTKEDKTMPKSYEQLHEDAQQEVVEVIEDVLELFGFADPGHYAPDVIDEIDEIVRTLSADEGE